MSEALNDPKNDPDEPDILDPNVREEKLKYLYGQMAGYPLQLSEQHFFSCWIYSPYLPWFILCGRMFYICEYKQYDPTR